MRRIVFICSGNLCRSPMAAGLARKAFTSRGQSVAIISGGTLNIAHQPAAPNAILAMREVGIDISEHRSQGISLGLARMADDLVVMAPEHAEYLRRLDPDLVQKTVRLWEFAGERLDEIADPVGRDLDAFRRCRELLDTCVEAWIDSL